MANCSPTYETKCSAWYLKMVPDSTLDVVPHGTRTSEQNKSKMEQRLEHMYMSLCLQNSFLARPPGGHCIALCTLEAAVSDVLCK
jgi:hypothetical protein